MKHSEIRDQYAAEGRRRLAAIAPSATGHRRFAMSSSFTNHTLVQIELRTNPGKFQNKVYTLPKQLDEKVARLHRAKIGVKLTKLSEKQASYTGVPAEGPFKPDHNRY